jgi:hypothetical protein
MLSRDNDQSDENRTALRLIIDLDLERLPDDQAREAGRILRYWAGALRQMDLNQPTEHPLMDSNYQAVGSLRLLEAGVPGVSGTSR